MGQAHANHALAGYLALVMVLIGFTFAALLYVYGVLDPEEARNQFPGIYRFLSHKWYFDELYSAILVRPAVTVAHWCRLFDTRVIDGAVDGTAKVTVRVSQGSGLFDKGIVDGLVNLTGNVFLRHRSLAAQCADGLFAKLCIVPGARRGGHLDYFDHLVESAARGRKINGEGWVLVLPPLAA